MNFYFSQNGKVTVNDFLDTMMSDPGPPVMVWLPLLHRMASVENGKLKIITNKNHNVDLIIKLYIVFYWFIFVYFLTHHRFLLQGYENKI